MLEECKKGKHDLRFIMRQSINILEDDVVKWCSICGCIVIDTESDGRIYPGRIMKMASPLISKGLV